MLVDAEGRQYEVFTPEEGRLVRRWRRHFVRRTGRGARSGDRRHTRRRRGCGFQHGHDRASVHAGRRPLRGARRRCDRDIDISYVLNSSMEVCVPLPPEARRDISDVAIVAENPDGTQTALSTSVRITDAGIIACGRLSALPASIAVGTAGSPDAIPTPNPDPIESPDTGGRAPSQSRLLVLAIISIAVILAGAASASFRRKRWTHLV